jgi:hypothetical protein
MTIEATPVARRLDEPWTLQWTPIIAGALIATAVSSILITFAATVGQRRGCRAARWAAWHRGLGSGGDPRRAPCRTHRHGRKPADGIGNTDVRDRADRSEL